MTLESAYREGYRNGKNGWGMLAGITAYRNVAWCAEWIAGYSDALHGKPNKFEA